MISSESVSAHNVDERCVDSGRIWKILCEHRLLLHATVSPDTM